MSGYFFVQSLFVLGSSIWPKNSFLKTFAAGTVIVMVYFLVGILMSKILLENGQYYPGGIFESKDTICVGELDAGLFPL